MGGKLSLHDACASTDLHAVKQLLRDCTEAELEEKDSLGRTPLLRAVAALKRKSEEEEEEEDMYDEMFRGFDQGDEDDEDDDAQQVDEDIGDEHKSLSIGAVLHMSRRGSQTDTPVATAQEQQPTHPESEENDETVDSSAQADSDATQDQRQEQVEDREVEHQNVEREQEQLQEKTMEQTSEPPTSMTPAPGISKKHARAFEILRLLLGKGVNLDHRDEHGWTALHYACSVQNPIAMQMLLQAGAQPTRDSYGLLPQDLMRKTHHFQNDEQFDQMKKLLDQLTDNNSYSIKLLTLRPSGIVQVDLGAQIEQGSLLTVEYDVPENHSPKDYIQMLITKESSRDVTMGNHYYVPKGGKGRITVNTEAIGPSNWIRFVYIKCDINSISRTVVASGCNAMIESAVGEIFQYELYLYQRVVEVETIPEFDFIDQPLLILKRIGIAKNDSQEIDWVNVHPENHIVAVNDIPIDHLDFDHAVRILQENNGKDCTKLLMQNYAACGDFIPEKVLGVGVIGKYASLHPISGEQGAEAEESATDERVSQSKMNDWIEPTEPTDQVAESTSASSSGDKPGASTKARYENPDTCSPLANEQVIPVHFSPKMVEHLYHGIQHSIGK